MACEKEGRDKPPLRPSEEEMAVRRKAKERIFAKYGLTSWQNAPRGGPSRVPRLPAGQNGRTPGLWREGGVTHAE